MTLANLHVAKQ